MAEAFPAILCRLRKERGLNQRTAAAALHISQALLSHYENGLREPGLAFVAEASAYYGVSADYLLGLTCIRTPRPRADDWDQALLRLAETGAEALARIAEALGATEDGETSRLAGEWLTVELYALLRSYDLEGVCTLPRDLSDSLCRVYGGLVRSRLLPGEPGAPDLHMPPALAEKAEGLLRKLWDEWREQV